MKIGSALLVFCLTALPAGAAAQSSSAVAETLFNEGRALYESGQFEQACPKFRESDRIEPAVGSKLNLALCEEKLGRIATAWALFRVVAETLPPTDSRLPIAEQHREALSARVPYVTIRLKPSAPPSTVVNVGELQLSGASFGTPLALDPGEHTLLVRAVGHADATAFITAVEGRTIEAEVAPGPLLPAPAAPPNAAAPDAPLPPASGPPAGAREPTFTPLRIGAVSAGAAGLVSFAVSGIFAVHATNLDRESTELGCVENRCPPGAKQARLDALAAADRATGFAIAGTALVAGGVALWFVGAPRSVQVGVHVDGSGVQAHLRAALP